MLVGGWATHFEKYARQIGSFPQGECKKILHLEPPPSMGISANKVDFSEAIPSTCP